ncbi:MAG: MFS transporter [Sulfolobus sp.]
MKKVFIIFLTSASFFMSYFSRIAWSIVSVYSNLKPTEIEDSIIFSLFFIGYILVQLPAGFLSDKVKPNIIALISLLGLSFSSFLSGLGISIEVEYIASFLMGLSAGWIYPVTIKILSTSFDKNELPVAIGYYSLAWPLSIVLAGLILPIISLSFGWNWSYYLIALSSLVLALSYLKVKSYTTSSTQFAIIKDKKVLTLAFSGFLFFLSYWVITLYAYKYFLSIGLNPIIAGFAYSSLALAGIPSTIIAGYIISKIGVRNTLSFFEFIYGVLTALLSIGNVILIVSVLMGFVRFIITPANSSAVSLIGGRNAGSVSGFANFFWQSSGIVAPFIASIIILNFGYLLLWIICSILIIVSSLIYYVLLR